MNIGENKPIWDDQELSAILTKIKNKVNLITGLVATVATRSRPSRSLFTFGVLPNCSIGRDRVHDLVLARQVCEHLSGRGNILFFHGYNEFPCIRPIEEH